MTKRTLTMQEQLRLELVELAKLLGHTPSWTRKVLSLSDSARASLLAELLIEQLRKKPRT